MGSPQGEAYFRWYYENNIWKDMHYRGVRTLKCPSDMWNYQEIITNISASIVLEVPALYLPSLLPPAARC